MREDELVAFGSAEEFERYENDDIQDKFDEDGEIESGSDCCDGGCSNDEGNGDACHEDSDCDVGDGDGSTTAARLIEKKKFMQKADHHHHSSILANMLCLIKKTLDETVAHNTRQTPGTCRQEGALLLCVVRQ